MKLILVYSLALATAAAAFSTAPPSTTTPKYHHSLGAQKKSSESELALVEQESETPAGVAGADFFGGNRQKEELYDPVAEAQADIVGQEESYDKFADTLAFSTPLAQNVGKSLQKLVNGILYEDEEQAGDDTNEDATTITYAPNVQWESPFGSKSSSPLEQLREALDFYNRLDVAIISAAEQTTTPQTLRVRWEISVMWPIFYQARVVLTGTSELTLDNNNNNNNRILKQVDRLDPSDLLSAIVPQVLPRFWDTYHIGMTPSAERTPQLSVSAGLLKNYRLYEIMPRLVYHPTLLDTGSREDAFAQVIPNHAFCTLIKTMGPKRQRYVPTSPVEVQLSRNSDKKQLIAWNIPVTVELQSNGVLPLPGSDPETPAESMPTANYEFQPRRRVATMAYGGSPQDAEVAEVRKQLYEEVIKDGHTPKLDKETKRPQFFFLQHDAKACYTADGGLGMGVYDWRPKFAKANEVGIELELPGNELTTA